MVQTKLSKTRLKIRIRKKTNPTIAATLSAVAKNPSWIKYAKLISAPTRKHISINLMDIDKAAKEGDTIFVPGKVLSVGELTKKIRLVSFAISQTAKEKMKKTKSNAVSILEEIKSNPKAEGIKLIR